MTKKTTFLAAGVLVAGFVLGFYTFDNTSGNTAEIVPTSTGVITGTVDKTIDNAGVTTENTNVAPTAVPAVPEENTVESLDATE
jgi:hypothetical protein